MEETYEQMKERHAREMGEAMRDDMFLYDAMISELALWAYGPLHERSRQIVLDELDIYPSQRVMKLMDRAQNVVEEINKRREELCSGS